ncbi:MAG: HEPN domain-containing protein [Candidatus Woesearchaeota archaeon]
MEKDEKVSKYLNDAKEWLEASKLSYNKTLSPCAFNALHSVELACKSALLLRTGNEYKTHNVAGEFGKYFKDELSRDLCRNLAKKLMKYSSLRYPDESISKKRSERNCRFF